MRPTLVILQFSVEALSGIFRMSSSYAELFSEKCAASNIVEDVCRLYPDVRVDHASSLRVSKRADAEMLGFEVDPAALIPHLLLIDDGIAGSEWNLVSIVPDVNCSGYSEDGLCYCLVDCRCVGCVLLSGEMEIQSSTDFVDSIF